jgi:presenilin-like A22 family membrane protease
MRAINSAIFLVSAKIVFVILGLIIKGRFLGHNLMTQLMSGSDHPGAPTDHSGRKTISRWGVSGIALKEQT